MALPTPLEPPAAPAPLPPPALGFTGDLPLEAEEDCFLRSLACAAASSASFWACSLACRSEYHASKSAHFFSKKSESLAVDWETGRFGSGLKVREFWKMSRTSAAKASGES